MDFILGIFTGISLAILWGMYLNKQREKKKHSGQYTDQEKAMAAAAAMYAAANAIMTTSVFPHYQLIDQLQKAIDSENYEEAARLRDLMNKK